MCCGSASSSVLGILVSSIAKQLLSLGIILVDGTLVHSYDPRNDWWVIQGMLTKLLTSCNTVLFLFRGKKTGHELRRNAVDVQITHENCPQSSVWHINDCSNIINGSLTILMHKPRNCFHIFRWWLREMPWPLVVFERSASLETRVPLETPGTNHGLNSICTSYYFKSLHSRFAEYQKELEVCSLLQFHVHDEIANVKAHVVTHSCYATPNVHTETPLSILSGDIPCYQAQRMHSRTAIGWHSMELVSKHFDTPTYITHMWERPTR
jgi:hypothetical protein